MKKQFVKTSNYEQFQAGIRTVEGRGALEASMMLVTGEPGYGKSETVDRWSAQVSAAFLRAKEQWTPAFFMGELAETLGVDARGRAKDIFARVVAKLGAEQIPLVIDEVEHTLRNAAQVLETVRDISDIAENIVVLVGMEQVQAKIARYKQISSRIAQVVVFNPATPEDVLATCQQLADVVIAPDLAREIHRQANGRMREIMNAIALVEREARKNKKTQVALADFSGRPLVFDWQARRQRLAVVGAR